MARRRSTPLGRGVLELDADDSKFHSKLSGARIAAERWTDQTGASLQRAGKAISGVGQSWTRNVTLPILAAGGATAKIGLDFDTTFRQIVGLTDVTGDQVDGLKEKVLALGPAVGKGPNELAEALYFIVSAGFEADEAMDVLETSAKAAAAGLGDTQVVAQVLGSVINAYGKENIKAADAAGILTEAVSQGTAEADAFAGVVGRVVPAAANLGVSFDQVTAALAAMTLTGLSAEEAAVGLNQVFVSLLKPTTEAEDALADMGLSAEGLRRQLREEGLLATLRTLEERFGGNEEAAAKVFGNVRALRTVTALLGLETDQLNDIFEKTASSGAARLAQAYEDTEGPQRRLDRAMAGLEATAISLGSDVLPIVVEILEAVAEGAASAGEWWRSLDDDTRDLVVRLAALVAVAGPLLIVVGKLTTGVGLLFKAVTFLAGARGIPAAVGAMKGLSAASVVALGPIGLVAGAVLALTTDFLGLRTAMNEASDAIPGDDWVEENIRPDKWGAAIHDFIFGIDELEDAVSGVDFSPLDREAQRAFQRMNAAARTESVETALIAAGVAPEVAALLAEGAGDIGDGAEDAFAPLEEEADKAREAALDQMKAMLGGIANLFETDDSLREAMQGLLDRMDDPYTEAERRADIFSKDTVNVIRQALKTGDPLIEHDTAVLVENMLGQIQAMEPGALQTGEAVPPALRDGMNAQVGALITWIETNVTGQALTSLTLEEASEIGFGNLWRYAQGMERAQREEVSKRITTLQNDLRTRTSVSLWQSGYNAVTSLADGMSAAEWRVRDASYGIGNTLRGGLAIYSEPKDPRSPLHGITRWGGNYVDTIADGMLGRVGAALQAAYTIADAMSLRNLDAGTPMVPSLSATAGDVASLGAAAAGMSVGAGSVAGDLHYHWHLEVEGLAKEVSSEREALEELRRMSVWERVGG